MSVKVIRYVFEEPLKQHGGVVTELVATVGTVNLAALGEHAKLRRMYQLHFDTMAGFNNGKRPSDADWEKVDPALVANNALWARWARIKVSLRGLKARMAGDGGAESEVSLDFFGWESLEGLSSIPVDLFEALDVAAVQTNPRIFGAFIPEEADSKNVPTVGVISVT